MTKFCVFLLNIGHLNQCKTFAQRLRQFLCMVFTLYLIFIRGLYVCIVASTSNCIQSKAHSTQHNRVIVLSWQFGHFMQSWFRLMTIRIVNVPFSLKELMTTFANEQIYKSIATEFNIPCRCTWEWWYRFLMII